MEITYSLIKTAAPLNKHPDEWATELNKYLDQAEIDTQLRVAHFLAQCTHESLDFTVLKENLNYSASGLISIFSKYFTPTETQTFARCPERIANRVYANRMGNGDEASGDGWKYKGRGAIQCTGKSNYSSFSMHEFSDYRILNEPEYLETIEGAIRSAVWFWNRNNINTLADKDDIVGITKRINGGTHGLPDRQARFDRIYKYLTKS